MGEVGFYLLFSLFIVIAMIFTSRGLLVVRQDEQVIVEKLGAFDRVLGVGLHFIVPFFERVALKIDNSEKVIPLEVIRLVTKDDKELKLLCKVHYLVTDVKLFHYGVKDIDSSISGLFIDTLKKEILKIDYEDLGNELVSIEVNIKEALTSITFPVGMDVSRISIEKKIS